MIGSVLTIVRVKWRSKTKRASGDLVPASQGVKPIHGDGVGSPGIGHLQGVFKHRSCHSHANGFVSKAVVGRRRRGGNNNIAICADNFADILHITAGGKSHTVQIQIGGGVDVGKRYAGRRNDDPINAVGTGENLAIVADGDETGAGVGHRVKRRIDA